MKKSHIVILITGVVLVLCVCVGIYITNLVGSRNREITLLEYGDTFPTETLYNFDGNNYIPENKYHIYIYISKYCGSCLEKMPSISKLLKIYSSSKLSIKIIWQEETPPVNILNKYDVSTENCLFIDRHVLLSSSVPKYYIVDNNNRVVFVDNIIKNLVEKTKSLELVEEEWLFENAVDYIISNYVKHIKKDTIIYFTMEGCKDCQRADIIIDTIIKEYEVDLIKIYSYHSDDPRKICDTDALFLGAFDIDWYPSFLILTESEHLFIGRTEEDKLEDYIVSVLVK